MQFISTLTFKFLKINKMYVLMENNSCTNKFEFFFRFHCSDVILFRDNEMSLYTRH